MNAIAPRARPIRRHPKRSAAWQRGAVKAASATIAGATCAGSNAARRMRRYWKVRQVAAGMATATKQ